MIQGKQLPSFSFICINVNAQVPMRVIKPVAWLQQIFAWASQWHWIVSVQDSGDELVLDIRPKLSQSLRTPGLQMWTVCTKKNIFVCLFLDRHRAFQWAASHDCIYFDVVSRREETLSFHSSLKQDVQKLEKEGFFGQMLLWSQWEDYKIRSFDWHSSSIWL